MSCIVCRFISIGIVYGLTNGAKDGCRKYWKEQSGRTASEKRVGRRYQVFAPGQETGFLHTHRNHEELYFFLGGKGEFQVDGKVFPVEEGSVVRVAPAGERSVRNNGAEPLVMLCVQYRGGTFTAEDASDGNLLTKPVKW